MSLTLNIKANDVLFNQQCINNIADVSCRLTQKNRHKAGFIYMEGNDALSSNSIIEELEELNDYLENNVPYFQGPEI